MAVWPMVTPCSVVDYACLHSRIGGPVKPSKRSLIFLKKIMFSLGAPSFVWSFYRASAHPSVAGKGVFPRESGLRPRVPTDGEPPLSLSLASGLVTMILSLFPLG